MQKGANAPFTFPNQEIFPPSSEISFFSLFFVISLILLNYLLSFLVKMK